MTPKCHKYSSIPKNQWESSNNVFIMTVSRICLTSSITVLELLTTTHIFPFLVLSSSLMSPSCKWDHLWSTSSWSHPSSNWSSSSIFNLKAKIINISTMNFSAAHGYLIGFASPYFTAKACRYIMTWWYGMPKNLVTRFISKKMKEIDT